MRAATFEGVANQTGMVINPYDPDQVPSDDEDDSSHHGRFATRSAGHLGETPEGLPTNLMVTIVIVTSSTSFHSH